MVRDGVASSPRTPCVSQSFTRTECATSLVRCVVSGMYHAQPSAMTITVRGRPVARTLVTRTVNGGGVRGSAQHRSSWSPAVTNARIAMTFERIAELLEQQGASPVSYTHLTLPTSD